MMKESFINYYVTAEYHGIVRSLCPHSVASFARAGARFQCRAVRQGKSVGAAMLSARAPAGDRRRDPRLCGAGGAGRGWVGSGGVCQPVDRPRAGEEGARAGKGDPDFPGNPGVLHDFWRFRLSAQGGRDRFEIFFQFSDRPPDASAGRGRRALDDLPGRDQAGQPLAGRACGLMRELERAVLALSLVLAGAREALHQSNFPPSSAKPLRNSAAGKRLPPGFCNSVRRSTLSPQTTSTPVCASAASTCPGVLSEEGGAISACQILIGTPLNKAKAPGKGLNARTLRAST